MKNILTFLIPFILLPCLLFGAYEGCYTKIDSFRYYRNHPELWEDSYLKREALGLPQPEPKQIQALIFTAGTTWVEGHLTTSAVWDTTHSPYIIRGDFYIDYPCTLWVRPGVEVLFHQPCRYLYSIIVNGYLLSEGTEEDSVIISYDSLISGVCEWNAIIFQNPLDSISTIKYSKVVNGGGWATINPQYGFETIEHCYIDLSGSGSAVSCGVWCWHNSSLLIRNCRIIADVAISLEDNSCATIIKNYFSRISHAVNMEHSTSAVIDSNYFYDIYEGVEILNSSPDCDILLRRNVFEKVSSKAIDVHGSNSIVEIFNNTFCNNEEFGVVVCYGGKAEIINNIFSQNGTDSSIYRGAIAICLDVPYILVKYNLFFNNFNDFGGADYYTPPGVKEITTINFNGDSCDTFFNLFGFDPLLDTITFYLNEGSPCINAGDPSLPWDPDSTIPDIGAHYYNTTPWVTETEHKTPDKYYILCYPNPFNSACRITVTSSELIVASFEVYDINGKKVGELGYPSKQTMRSGERSSVRAFEGPGSHNQSRGLVSGVFSKNSTDSRIPGSPVYSWSPEKTTPSGIYLIKVQMGTQTTVKKVVYLK